MILQLAGVIAGVAGWLLHQPILFVLGGLLYLGAIMIGSITGDLNLGGQLMCFITLLIGLFVGAYISSWWKGLLGAAIVANAMELVTLPFFLRWWNALLSEQLDNTNEAEHGNKSTETGKRPYSENQEE